MTKPQVKRKTSLDKIAPRKRSGRSKSTELSARGRAQDTKDVTPVLSPSESQQRGGVHTLARKRFVPVVDKEQKPLMPTTPKKARKWIASGKATPFFSKGLFCVRLNVEPSARNIQDVAVGIDPGSKREAFTVKAEAHTYLNVLSDAVTWVSRNVKTRRMLRRSRRNRNTPCRQNRMNRSRGNLSPSTRARWQLKLRVVSWLSRIFPINMSVTEDIKAKSKGQRKWDSSFSPLEVGKTFFYKEMEKYGKVHTKQGYETYEIRNNHGLHKTTSKMLESFDAHNVDSWVLASWLVGGHTKPDNTEIFRIFPLRFHRRQLFPTQPPRGGRLRVYGSTTTFGNRRGSIVRYNEKGLYFLGGSSKKGISLHDISSGKRLCRSAKISNIKFLSFNSFGVRQFLPYRKVRTPLFSIS